MQASEDVAARAIAGRYLVEAELGRGAMGSVYRVRDLARGRLLALKQLHRFDRPEHSEVRRVRAELWFRREFHVVAGLRHPCIVSAHDFGIDEGCPYYTMELLDGHDLREAGPLGVEEACRVLRDVASALAFLHAKHLLHRDLKGRNVRLTSGRTKLLDFGVLATMGITGDVAGTPPSIPPEAVRRLPLDARADLYGLGALSYWLLTGRHAYPGRKIDELEGLWRERPPAPSRLAADIPAALDELVLSLLAIDRSARPGSAAEVIDRLAAIGGLPRDPEIEVARGWLTSAGLVGREPEMQRIRAELRNSIRGRGGVVVVQAPSGVGKSRLLREAGVEAQLGGAAVLRARADAVALAPYAMVRKLVRELYAACPLEARRTARAHVSTIGRVFPEVVPYGDAIAGFAALGDPAEERLRLQSELLDWFVELAAAQPLVILVDDVQRTDEASAAFLATLAHVADQHAIIIVAALRTDERPVAAAACAALVERGVVLRLADLDRAGVEALVRASFGDVPHASRIAEWIGRVGGGNAMLSTELARHLVDRGVVRYEGGAWTLAGELALELPEQLADALELRVAALGPDARELAEALAVAGVPLPLHACARLLGEDAEARAFAALDELVFQDVVVGDDRLIELRHDAVRESVLRALEGERRGRLHRRVGDVLAADDELAVTHRGRIGGLLLEGGDRERAATMLEQAGRELYDSQSFADAVGPLRAALEVYEGSGSVGRLRRLELRHMLMRAGVVCDRAIVLRYADETLAELVDDSGLRLAGRASKRVGRRLGLAIGLAGAWLRWLFGGRKTKLSPPSAIATTVALVGYVASVHSLAYATAPLRGLIALLDPLRCMRRRVPGAASLLIENFLLIAQGRWRALERNVGEVLDALEHDRRTRLGEIDRKLGRGAALYMRVAARALDHDTAYAQSIAELEALDLRFFDMSAQMAQAMFHRLRGEEPRARELLARAEMLFVRLGNAWVFDSQLAWISSMAYGMTSDVTGLKRTIEQLDRLCDGGYRVQGFAAIARGEYQRACGDPIGARVLLDRALAEIEPDNLLLGQLARAALADSLVEERDFARAAGVAQAGLREDDGERGLETLRLRLRRALALARCGLGDVDGAASELRELVALADRIGSPVVSGLVHEARVTVARASGDVRTARTDLAVAERHFERTANPVLVARARRLAGDDRRERGGTGSREDGATVQLGPATEDSQIAPDTVLSRRSQDLT